MSGRTVWLGRRDYDHSYRIGTRKNDWNETWGFMETGLINLCAKDFQRVTGYKLKLGEVKKVRINIEEVK